MNLTLGPLSHDLTQHGHPARARRGLDDGVDDVDVFAQHVAAQFDEWIEGHASGQLQFWPVVAPVLPKLSTRDSGDRLDRGTAVRWRFASSFPVPYRLHRFIQLLGQC